MLLRMTVYIDALDAIQRKPPSSLPLSSSTFESRTASIDPSNAITSCWNAAENIQDNQSSIFPPTWILSLKVLENIQNDVGDDILHPKMSSLSIHRGPFSFFWLPVEIRRLIYRHLLYARGDDINRERLSINREYIDPFYEKTRVYTAILETCWTIYREAIGILYGDNTFRWNSVHNMNAMPTLLSGIKTEDLHRNVQLKISFVALSKPTIDRNNFLLRITGPKVPRDVLEIYVGIGGPLANSITHKIEAPSHLTSPIIQAIKHLSGFKKVIVRLSPRHTGFSRSKRRGQPAEYVWSESLTLELESGLGPNISKDEARLEFRPKDQPKHWAREHISPLLRLSEVDRQRIIRLTIGPRPLLYPSTITNGGGWSFSKQWRVLPQLQTANPHMGSWYPVYMSEAVGTIVADPCQIQVFHFWFRFRGSSNSF